MPDQPDPTPGGEEELRRLLREARHEASIPPAVAARLDQALLEERQAAAAPDSAPAPVVPLEHRRRQRALALLVAAATIVTVGVGIGRLLRPGVDTASSSVSDIDRRVDPGGSREKVERGSAAERRLAADPAPSGAGSSQGGVGAARVRLPAFLTEVPEVSDAEFVRDVRTVRRLVRETPPTLHAEASGTFTCEPTDWGRGTAVAVRYDQAPSVLVLRPPVGETQVADLLQCGSGEVLRSVTLPAP